MLSWRKITRGIKTQPSSLSEDCLSVLQVLHLQHLQQEGEVRQVDLKIFRYATL